jgi:hypothetical protein
MEPRSGGADGLGGRLGRILQNLVDSGPVLREVSSSKNLRVLAQLLGPAYRGLISQRAKGVDGIGMPVSFATHFDLRYRRQFPEMAKLYEAAKTSQWNSSSDIDWSVNVDPFDPDKPLIPDSFLPVSQIPSWGTLTERERNIQRHALLSWMLSQFLHGEQGALFAAAQVTEAVPWLDGKLYGSTQVVDEGRHVEVFHRYLSQKLEKLYEINDNLYVVIDALMTDSRWDVKFLGMQIMIEGLALGAFGTIRQVTREPLLKELLGYVIKDEARHVHYGVLALRQFYVHERQASRDREDWAYEVAVLFRNRFLAHEFYDEFYGHLMTRRQWDALVLGSPLMVFFRKTMFRRILPNLKRIGLLSDRVRPHYAAIGLLEYESGKAAHELTAQDLLDDT